MFSSILGTASALLLIASSVHSQAINDDTYFYGQSPPVYPSPPMAGTGSWSSAYKKAVALVSQMTLAERANISVGYTSVTGCSGETGTVPRLNWTGLCLSDAGNGLRDTDFVNSYPSGVHVGAAWNRNLSYARALHMGGEFKTKGSHVVLGPVAAPLGRVAEGGRNWEGFTVDPYLSGQLVSETVHGIQDAGVISCVKHFIGYEQETNRNPAVNLNLTTLSVTPGDVASVSSNIDDRTLHELYLPPFADALYAGAGSVMCSYNRINNSYACQNSKSLNGILKTELGFEGFVVTDWTAEHGGLASAEAGLDLVMPTSSFRGVSGEVLVEAVNNGSLPESRLTDIATRIVATWYQLNQDSDYPERGIGLATTLSANHTPVYARDPASKSTILNGAIEGHVLVKNEGILPLKSPKLLSIYGYDAVVPAIVDVPSPSALLGLGPYGYGYEATNFTDAIITLETGGAFPAYAVGGTIISGGGSGANAPPYISAPFDALQSRAYEDGTALFWDFTSQNPAVDPTTDACLVFINAFASEGSDRSALSDSYSDTLVQNVAAACPNTIVVIHNAGIRLVDAWIENPNVKAVIFAHLPGQDSGRAVVDILYGVQSPSGKLPYTVAKSASDYNVLSPSLPEGQYIHYPQSNFTEGTFIDYHYFDAHNVTPRFEFGFGLTYTTFEYSKLAVAKLPGVSVSYLPPARPIVQGGNPSLWDVVAQVTAVITNTGSVSAAEVAQLYVGIPGNNVPVRQLRGFSKVTVPVGDSVQVTFDLRRRDLSIWDVKLQNWVLQRGTYKIYVGASSRNLPLVGSLFLGNSTIGNSSSVAIPSSRPTLK